MGCSAAQRSAAKPGGGRRGEGRRGRGQRRRRRARPSPTLRPGRPVRREYFATSTSRARARGRGAGLRSADRQPGYILTRTRHLALGEDQGLLADRREFRPMSSARIDSDLALPRSMRPQAPAADLGTSSDLMIGDRHRHRQRFGEPKRDHRRGECHRQVDRAGNRRYSDFIRPRLDQRQFRGPLVNIDGKWSASTPPSTTTPAASVSPSPSTARHVGRPHALRLGVASLDRRRGPGLGAAPARAEPRSRCGGDTGLRQSGGVCGPGRGDILLASRGQKLRMRRIWTVLARSAADARPSTWRRGATAAATVQPGGPLGILGQCRVSTDAVVG